MRSVTPVRCPWRIEVALASLGQIVDAGGLVGSQVELERREVLAAALRVRRERQHQYAVLKREPGDRDLSRRGVVRGGDLLQLGLVDHLARAAAERSVRLHEQVLFGRHLEYLPLREVRVELDLVGEQLRRDLDLLAQHVRREVAHAELADEPAGTQPLELLERWGEL